MEPRRWRIHQLSAFTRPQKNTLSSDFPKRFQTKRPKKKRFIRLSSNVSLNLRSLLSQILIIFMLIPSSAKLHSLSVRKEMLNIEWRRRLITPTSEITQLTRSTRWPVPPTTSTTATPESTNNYHHRWISYRIQSITQFYRFYAISQKDFVCWFIWESNERDFDDFF